MSLEIEKADWTKLFDLVITQGYGVSLGKEWAIINVSHTYSLSEEISEGVLGAAAKVVLAEAISETLISRIGLLSHLTFRITETISDVCKRAHLLYPSEAISEDMLFNVSHAFSIEEAISEIVTENVSHFFNLEETITEGSWIELQEFLTEAISEAVLVNISHLIAVSEAISEVGSENVSHQLDLYETISEIVLTSCVVDLAETISEIVVLDYRQSVTMSEGAFASKGISVPDTMSEVSNENSTKAKACIGSETISESPLRTNPKKYVELSSLANFSFGSVGTYKVEEAVQTPANLTLSIDESSTEDIAWVSDAGQPNRLTWTGGTYTWKLNVKTANAYLKLVAVTIYRIASDNATIRASKVSSVSVSLGSTGIKSGTIAWNDGTQNPAGCAASDRIIIDFNIQNTSGNSASFVVETGDLTNDANLTPLT